MSLLSNPDLVIHLAWSGLPHYYNWQHFTTNLQVSFQFISNLARGGLKDITVSGTCLEYGFREGRLSEDLPAEPANPYAIAKDSLRRALEHLAREHDLTYKWLRLFYMYGEGQKPNAIIPQLEAALQRRDSVFNMSGGEQVRDYLPVTVVAANICMVALQQEVTGIINCCSGTGTMVKDLVAAHLQKSGRDVKLNLGHYPYPVHEPFQFWGDDSKLKQAVACYKHSYQ
jgi:dTDP-6-deoxy-L-talose 4-dehydrogenase (NAD+)